MIQTVLFDLDGTLLNRDASVQQFVAAQYQRLDFDIGHVPQRDFVARWLELDCRGHVWKDAVYQQLVLEFDITKLRWQELLQDYETQFIFHCVPFNGLKEMLFCLKQRGYALGIITNGRGVFQSRAIDGLGITNFFDTILISEIEGIRKPQSEIFHRALFKLSSVADETVFVGDDPEADVRGAKGAGLKAVWKRHSFCSEPQEADATLDALDELPDIVQQL